MIAEPFDLLFRLDADIGAKRSVGRRDRPAEHEVLPHHQPELVGHVVKGVVEIIATAPHAQHVHVGVACGEQQRAHRFRGGARRQAVERDQVGTLGEDRRAVDAEAHRAAIADQLDRAQADPPFGRVGRSAILLERRRHPVERLLAVADRLPALRLRDGERQRHRIVPRRQHNALRHRLVRTVGRGQHHTQRRHSGTIRLHRRARRQPRLGIVQRVLVDTQRVDPRAVPRLEPDRTPRPHRDDPRTPVPAIMVFRLADIGRGLAPAGIIAERRVILARQRPLRRQHDRRERADRRGDGDQDRVRAGLEIALGVDPPATMRIVGAEHGLPIDRHGREGVEPVEHQIEMIARQQRRRRDEGMAILPVGPPDPLDRGFVRRQERIGHAVLRDQILLDAAGHVHREPARLAPVCGDRVGIAGGDPRLPSAVECDRLPRCRADEARARQQRRQRDPAEDRAHQRASFSWTSATA